MPKIGKIVKQATNRSACSNFKKYSSTLQDNLSEKSCSAESVIDAG